VRRGYADLSFGNIGQALGTGFGFMGGMGPMMSMGKYGLSQLGFGNSPFGGLEGFGHYDQDLIDSIMTSDNPNIARGQMARLDRAQRERNEARAKSDAEKEARAERGREMRGV
jgi:hypothetical protein